MSAQRRKSVALIAEKVIKLDVNDMLNIRDMSIETGEAESLLTHNYKLDLAFGWLIDSQREIEDICQKIQTKL